MPKMKMQIPKKGTIDELKKILENYNIKVERLKIIHNVNMGKIEKISSINYDIEDQILSYQSKIDKINKIIENLTEYNCDTYQIDTDGLITYLKVVKE